MTALRTAPVPDTARFAWRPLAWLIAGLLGTGALLGLVWAAWSPPGPRGGILDAGIQPDETESFIAADGRFALLTAIAGLLAGVGAWYLRRQRGSLVAAVLAVGGLGGSLLTVWIGSLVRGEGRTYACGTETGRCVEHLPMEVHMHGLLFLEAAVAVLVYSMFVAFAVEDDLGRPDPARDAVQARRSVGPQGGVEDAWRDGDRPGAPQQDHFPPQYPDQPGQPLRGSEFGQQ